MKFTLIEAYELLKEHIHKPHIRRALNEAPKAPRKPQESAREDAVSQHHHAPRRRA